MDAWLRLQRMEWCDQHGNAWRGSHPGARQVRSRARAKSAIARNGVYPDSGATGMASGCCFADWANSRTICAGMMPSPQRKLGAVAAAHQPVLAGGRCTHCVRAPLPDHARISRADRLGEFVEPTIGRLARRRENTAVDQRLTRLDRRHVQVSVGGVVSRSARRVAVDSGSRPIARTDPRAGPTATPRPCTGNT